MFRELTRKNKKLTPEECIRILAEEKRGVLSVNGDGGYPYGAPMNHFYCEADGRIYFHCGNGDGHRLDALRRDARASFCVFNKGECKDGHWALHVKSVIVFGKIEIVSNPERIAEIARRLSLKFTADESYIQKEIEGHAHRTLLLVLTPEHICGKQVVEA